MTGHSYFERYLEAGGEPHFYQSAFAPAVALACGQGFVGIDGDSIPSLAGFLDGRASRFECADLPPEPRLRPFDYFQRHTRNLIYSAGLTWYLFGVSWEALAMLAAFFWGLQLLAAYGLFRAFAGRVGAVAVTLLVATSGLQLSYLPHLRDFAKSPFILLLLAGAALLPGAALGRRTLVALSLSGGLLAGIAFGFRPDVLLVLPVVIAAILFLAVPSDRRRWRVRLVSCAGFLVAFGLVAGPIMASRATDHNLWHVAILGFSPQFGDNLRVSEPPSYGVVSHYEDVFVISLVSGPYESGRDRPEPLRPSTRQYADASASFLLRLVRHFPADALIRSYASVRRVVGLPYEALELKADVPQGHAALFQRRSALMARLGSLGLWITLAAAVVLAGTCLKSGIAYLLLIGYLGVIATVQFETRHVFYLETVALIGLAILLDRALGTLKPSPGGWRRSWRERLARLSRPRLWSRDVRGILLFLAAASVVLVALLHGLRLYQQRHLDRLFGEYAALESDPLDLSMQRENGRIKALVGEELFGELAEDEAFWSYLVGEFAAHDECDYDAVDVTLRYRADIARFDFSDRLSVPLPRGDAATAKLFFPVLRIERIDFAVRGRSRRASARFVGLELHGAQARCLTRLGRVVDQDRVPLPLFLTLGENWPQERKYAVLSPAEGAEQAASGARVYTLPPGAAVTRTLLREPPPGAVPFAWTAAIARRPASDEALRVQGEAEGPYSYVATSGRAGFEAGAILVAKGELFAGGLTLGFERDDRWAGTLNIENPGRFTAVLEVPPGGVDRLVIANCLRGDERVNDFVLTQIGLHAPDAPGSETAPRDGA